MYGLGEQLPAQQDLGYKSTLFAFVGLFPPTRTPRTAAPPRRSPAPPAAVRERRGGGTTAAGSAGPSRPERGRVAPEKHGGAGGRAGGGAVRARGGRLGGREGLGGGRRRRLDGHSPHGTAGRALGAGDGSGRVCPLCGDGGGGPNIEPTRGVWFGGPVVLMCCGRNSEPFLLHSASSVPEIVASPPSFICLIPSSKTGGEKLLRCS